MTSSDKPRVIDPEKTFNALADWFHDEILVYRKAPGLIVGLSGTDSLISFLAVYRALASVGKADRLLGVHFAPSDDFLYDHPEAEAHLWFQHEIIPWLREKAPEAKIIVDTSIDWRFDGLRWGKLMEMSVVSDEKVRAMRAPEDQYWVVGTRNQTEDIMNNYSNTSIIASIQPLMQLWKSEILQISEHLGVPKKALEKSCEADCICGRLRIAGQHIKEIDWLLMQILADVSEEFIEENIDPELRKKLDVFIETQMKLKEFKSYIPYTPTNIVCEIKDEDILVKSFEDGSLNLREFNHEKHIYIAWIYLKTMPLEEAIEKYSKHLKSLLDAAGHGYKFNTTITRDYFVRIDQLIGMFYENDQFENIKCELKKK